MKKLVLLIALSVLIPATAQARPMDDRATAKTFDGVYKLNTASTAQTSTVKSSGTCAAYELQPEKFPSYDYVFVESGRVQRWHGNPPAALHEAGQIYSWRADAVAPQWGTMSFRFYLPLGPHNAHADLTVYVAQVRDDPGSDCRVTIHYVLRMHRDPKTWVRQ